MSTSRSTRPRMFDTVLVVVFILMLVLPGVAMIVKPPTRPTKSASGEAYPALSQLLRKARTPFETVGALREWFRTRYAFRTRLIEANARLKVRLGLSTSPLVTIGAKDWLFYNGENNLDSFRRVRPFSQAQLDEWRTVVDGWAKASASVGARLVIMIPPDKQTVYPELMPAWTAPVSAHSRLDQLATILVGRNDLEFVDVRPALAAARHAGVPLYYRTDTHWNSLGAYVANRELMRTLAKWFPAVTIPPEEPNAVVTHVSHGGDLARALGLKTRLDDVEVNPTAVRWRATLTDEKGQPWTATSPLEADIHHERLLRSSRPGAPIARAYVLRDSFGKALVPYLADSFESAVYRWTVFLDADALRELAPDVVIIELVERRLMADWKDMEK